MTRLAVHAGLAPGVVADLDEDGIDALARMVREREQGEAWTNLHEVLCAVVESNIAVMRRLEAGVPVAMVQKLSTPTEPEPFPRPAWITQSEPEIGETDDEGVIVVRHVRDALSLIKGGVSVNG